MRLIVVVVNSPSKGGRGSSPNSIRVELKGNTLDASAPEALFDVITSVSNGSLSTMPMAVTRDGSKILFPQWQPLPPTYVMTAWDTLLKR